VIAGREGDGSAVTDPHAQQPRGTVASLLKLAVVLADTVIGTWTRWRRVGRDRLLVVERGWYDLAVDPHRYRLPRGFTPLVAALGRLIPRADAVVVLSGDPAAFHARKPEIGVAEVGRQLDAWRRYAPRAARQVIEVDTVGQSPEASAERIVSALQGSDRRWYRVPVAPRRLDLRATGPGPALDVYRPHRRRARLATALNGPLLRSGRAPVVAPPPTPTLGTVLAALDRPAEQQAAFRSSAADRWVIGVADRALHAVVKCGSEQDAGLAREAAALRRLGSTERVVLPELLLEHVANGRRAIATAAVPTDGDEPDLDEVTDLATALARGDLGTPVVHGDLAPWNVARDGTRLVTWDLEDAELDVVRPLHDLTHYLVRAGTLLGRFTPAEVAGLLLGARGPGSKHLEALGLDTAEAGTHVRDYLERTRASSRTEQLFRDRLAGLLPTAGEVAAGP
jgi:hypothetical protein